MEATAKGRFQKISVRKARVIVNLIRGRNAAEALEMLRFTRKAAAPIVFKLLDSAISNARAKDPNLDLDTLRVSEVFADKATERQLEKGREQIRDRLTQLAPIFLKNKYMLGDDFSMLDVAIAPLLWRLDYYGIDLSKNAAPLLKYAERIFSRPAYIEALTPSEKVMRK